MRKKLLQNTLFVAMAAWAMYLAQQQGVLQHSAAFQDASGAMTLAAR